MKRNALKRYEKAGGMLRVETGINDPEKLRVRWRVRRRGPAADRVGAAQEACGLPIALSRSRATGGISTPWSRSTIPPPGLRGLDTITTRNSPAGGRTVTAFTPVARPDYQLFIALIAFGHRVMGASVRLRQLHFPAFYAEAA